jgi:hypothetical protein
LFTSFCESARFLRLACCRARNISNLASLLAFPSVAAPPFPLVGLPGVLKLSPFGAPPPSEPMNDAMSMIGRSFVALCGSKY